MKKYLAGRFLLCVMLVIGYQTAFTASENFNKGGIESARLHRHFLKNKAELLFIKIIPLCKQSVKFNCNAAQSGIIGDIFSAELMRIACAVESFVMMNAHIRTYPYKKAA